MRWIAVLALLIVGLAPAKAQTYPSKPIRVIVPYAPGGVADIAARLVGQKLTEAWGQQVVVENRTGGNGFIAVTATVKAPPDGYTLIVGTVGEFTINPALFKDIPYNVQRDLAPVGMVSDTPIVLAAHAGSPFNTVSDVVAAGKAQPGRVSIASPGNGTMNHLAIEWMGLGTGASSSTFPIAVERRPALRSRRATFRLGRWRFRRLCRTSSRTGCACSRSPPPGMCANSRNGEPCRI